MTLSDKLLNALSIVDKYPFPRIDERIDSPGAGKIYSTFDLIHGFFRLAADPDSAELTASTPLRGLHKWKHKSQGMQAAPVLLQGLYDKLSQGWNQYACIWTTPLYPIPHHPSTFRVFDLLFPLCVSMI